MFFTLLVLSDVVNIKLNIFIRLFGMKLHKHTMCDGANLVSSTQSQTVCSLVSLVSNL
jgi:hypothetical protein